MISFNNVSMRYADGFEALKSVSFQLADGEMAFLTGHSGAGKSTLLKLITISERPASGEILFKGLNLLISSLRFSIKYGKEPAN